MIVDRAQREERINALKSSIIILADGMSNVDLHIALRTELSKRGVQLCMQGDAAAAYRMLTDISDHVDKLSNYNGSMQRVRDIAQNLVNANVY